MRGVGIILAGLVALGAAPALGAPRAAASSCERACLTGMVDRYFDAVTTHDPGKLPLAKGVRYTENGQQLDIGDGLWGTAEARDGYHLFFVDTKSGQAGGFATLTESGRHQIVGVRLKVVGGMVTEIEALVVRPKPGAVFGEPAALRDKPEFRDELPPEQRLPRAELVKIADSYFEGLEQATETLTPFADGCQRIENGVVTASNPTATNVWKLDCHAQFATHFSQFITRIRERRYTIVDEERGLVFAQVFFDHAGKMKTQTLADGTDSPIPPDMQVPFTFQIGELFKIADGKIVRIEAVVFPVPYGMGSGWAK